MRTSAPPSFFGTVFSNIFQTEVFLHILLCNRTTSKAEAFLCSGITESLSAGLNWVGWEGERLRHKTVATKGRSGIVIFAFLYSGTVRETHSPETKPKGKENTWRGIYYIRLSTAHRNRCFGHKLLNISLLERLFLQGDLSPPHLTKDWNKNLLLSVVSSHICGHWWGICQSVKGASSLVVHYLAIFFLHAKWVHQGKRLPVTSWNSFRGKATSSEERGAYRIQVVTGEQLQGAGNKIQAPGKREIQGLSLPS